jgi:hypothetical protein
VGGLWLPFVVCLALRIFISKKLLIFKMGNLSWATLYLVFPALPFKDVAVSKFCDELR